MGDNIETVLSFMTRSMSGLISLISYTLAAVKYGAKDGAPVVCIVTDDVSVLMF